MLALVLGCIGTWVFADGIASLYTYTGDNPKAKGQTFWKDHCLRIVRCILGLVLIYTGYLEV